MQLLHGERHLLGGRDEQRAEADRRRVVLLGGLEDRADRDLLAEVDDRVAVVGEDRVDERLADVVHVAEHGREDDGALRVALDAVEVVLQPRDGALHDLGALQHERQDQLAGAELVADLLHRRQQHVVERRDRADLLDAAVDLVLDAVLLAAQDVQVQRLLGLHARGRVGRALVSASAPLHSKCSMNRSSASSRRLKTRSSASSRSSSVISPYGVMWFGLTIARSSPASTQWCRKTEFRTARAPGPTPKETFETPSDVFTPGSSALTRRMPSIVSTADGFHSSSPVVSVNVRTSKISSSRSRPCSLAQLVDALGDLDLALGGLGHADLVDRQRDQRGAVLDGERHDRVELVAAGLEVDRVDDRAARDLLERELDDVRLGRVDLQRRGLRERDALGDLAHLLVLVGALGQRDAEVEHVRAALDLVLGDLHEAVVVVGEQQLLGLARALRVDALADERRRGVLHERGRRTSSS